MAAFTRLRFAVLAALILFGITLSRAATAQVAAWGWNFNGQLGDVSSYRGGRPSHYMIDGLTGVTAVSAGWTHSLALRSDGTVWAWGANLWGQLGDGTFQEETVDRLTPAPVHGPGNVGILTGITAISAGAQYNLALRSDGTVWAWGANHLAELGNGGFDTRVVSPVQVRGPLNTGFLADIVAISAGTNHSLALRSDGTVWAWGMGHVGQLGNNRVDTWTYPQQVRGFSNDGFLTGVVAVEAGERHSLALLADGTVCGFGQNLNGELGIGTNSGVGSARAHYVPVSAVGLSGVTAISAGAYHSMALLSDGSVRTWGWNFYGEVGDGTRGSLEEVRPTPLSIGLTNVTAIAAGRWFSLAVLSDGTVQAWGLNASGVLGSGATDSSGRETRPIIVVGLTDVTAISGGFAHVLALRNQDPIADAGPDQALTVPHDGSPATNTAAFTLDGGASSNPGGGALQYQWTEDGSILGTSVTLALNRAPGNYTFTLTVLNVSGGSASDTVQVTVSPEPNGAPTANAGIDQSITVTHDGDPVTNTAAFTLDGSASSDPDGDTLTYAWKEGDTVVGSTATLDLSRPAGSYTFTLTVSDPYGSSSTNDVVVTVGPEPNAPPVANAGSDQVIECQGSVTLDGSGSSDPDGDTLTYRWYVRVPGAHPTFLSEGISPTLALSAGTHTLLLVVRDSYGLSSSDNVVVIVAAMGFEGFLEPIGGADETGGSFADPIRAFKLGSTIPVKFRATCCGAPVLTGIHTLQAVKYSSDVSADPPIDATPTDAATTGNQFRLTGDQWHFNMSTKGLSKGTWKLIATLSDGSTHSVWISIK